LYELTCPKEQAEDWVWLVDHTIQLDQVQCFLVVGVRLRCWEQNRRPLTHRDLHCLLLEPCTDTTGEAICEQLQRVVARTGVPRAILSDAGRNLHKGVGLFRESHPQITHNNDILHHAALCLKKILTKDERWDKFLTQCGLSRKRCKKTAKAFLAPPAVRDQARFMNLEAVLKWAGDIRGFIHDPARNNGKHVEPWVVAIEFKWLEEFEEAIELWERLLAIVEQALHYVRWEGYHADAATEMNQRLDALRGSSLGDELMETLLEFVREQSQAAMPNERLLGSTECLESLIGKGKRLEGQQSQHGFTKMILGIAASVVTPTLHAMDSALAAVKTKKVHAWALEHLGQSVQAQRRLAFAPNSQGTKMG
jgi:hypothetical protein